MKTDTTVIDKIKALVPGLAEQLGKLRAAQQDTNMRIAELSAERKALLASPITAEDYAELICLQIDRVADKYCNAVTINMLSQASGSARPSVPAKVSHALRHLEPVDPPSASMIGKIRHEIDFRDMDTEPLSQYAATFFMRDAMKKAAREIAENAKKSWPYRNAKPMRETIARIKEIDAELAALGIDKQALDEAEQSLQVVAQAAPEKPNPQ